MDKLTTAEISYLMQVLSPQDCALCIWLERDEEKYRCFSNGETPCRLFVDKVFHGLEKADLI